MGARPGPAAAAVAALVAAVTLGGCTAGSVEDDVAFERVRSDLRTRAVFPDPPPGERRDPLVCSRVTASAPALRAAAGRTAADADGLLARVRAGDLAPRREVQDAVRPFDGLGVLVDFSDTALLEALSAVRDAGLAMDTGLGNQDADQVRRGASRVVAALPRLRDLCATDAPARS